VPAANLPGMLQFFLVGFLLADLRATRTHSQSHRWWDLVSLVSWIVIFNLDESIVRWFLPVCILFAYLAAFYGPISRSIFSTNWIALTGGMCYSFYLMHMLVVSIGMHFTERFMIPSNYPLSAVIQMLLLTPFVYAVCTLYFVLIERPCMDPAWPHKLWLRASSVLRSESHHETPQ
jgi:peptidoglycan/LPS O-acetylase OafA/YrhL